MFAIVNRSPLRTLLTAAVMVTLLGAVAACPKPKKHPKDPHKPPKSSAPANLYVDGGVADGSYGY